MRKASTEVIIGALKILADDIHSPDDVPQLALREAWERLEELQDEVKTIKAQAIKETLEWVERMIKIIPEYTEEDDPTSWAESGYEEDGGYNKAIEDVLKLLKQKEL